MTLTEAVLVGAIAGGLLGLALSLLLAARGSSRATLAPRLTPYVRGPRRRPAPVRPDVRGPLGAIGRLAAPVVRDGGRLLERLGSTADSIRRRLDQLGSPATVEQFRLEQAAWAAGGTALALLVSGVLRTALPLGILLVLLGLVLGPLARDRLLTRSVERRRARLQEQLPDIAEMLALTVSAGESAVGALDRVARTAHGELADELRATVAEARAGTALTVALENLARRADVPALARFTEGVSVAVERGTPLSEVLRAQAADARAGRRRELMELGGKKEISMMAPVVFLILPVTVVFALFPGLVVLQVSV